MDVLVSVDICSSDEPDLSAGVDQCLHVGCELCDRVTDRGPLVEDGDLHTILLQLDQECVDVGASEFVHLDEDGFLCLLECLVDGYASAVREQERSHSGSVLVDLQWILCLSGYYPDLDPI